MLTTLALRHLVVRKRRSLFLLLGFSLGVGVMVVLLSVGQAMLDQSRDTSLVGGGELTALPQGIDIEAMRTGGMSGMFFGIERARFLVRQVLGGPRHRGLVRTVSPNIEGKLLYLHRGVRVLPVRAGGEIPSRATGVGSGLQILSGKWEDSAGDSMFIAPTRQQLYDELDRFHLPPSPDSSWGEWHYFNVVASPVEWWYITYLIGGAVELPFRNDVGRRWGGQLLITHRTPSGRHERFVRTIPAGQITFDTSRADLALGESFVTQRNGVYRLHAVLGGDGDPLRIDLQLSPAPNGYFPPVQLRDGDFVSGYVVPGLIASASGTICLRSRCRSLGRAPAYHDHNWGVWRDVTWEWGSARGAKLSLLYGGIYGPDRGAEDDASIQSPFFLTVLDSLGVKQVLRFHRIDYQGSQSVGDKVRVPAPRRFSLQAVRDNDTLNLSVRVLDALGTRMGASRLRRVFLQMRGDFRVSGRLLGEVVADSGSGFFETYVTPR